MHYVFIYCKVFLMPFFPLMLVLNPLIVNHKSTTSLSSSKDCFSSGISDINPQWKSTLGSWKSVKLCHL